MFAQTGYGNMMAGQHVLGAFGILPVIGILVTASIVALVIWAIARKHSHGIVAVSGGSPPSTADNALSIVRERLARGEIEPEQYTAVVAALDQRPPTSSLDG